MKANLRKKLVYILFIDLLLLALISAQYIFYIALGEYYFKVLQVELLLVYLWCVLTCRSVTNNWLSLEILFYITVFIFLLSRIFLNLFFPNTFLAYGESQWLDGHQFQPQTLTTLHFLLLFTLLALHVGIFYGYRSFSLTKTIQFTSYKYLNRKVAIALLVIGFTCFIIKIIYIKHILDTYGYFAIYSGLHTPPLALRIFDNFFYIGYFMFICTFPTKSVAYRLSLIFMIFYSAYVLTGMRAEFVLMLLTTLWLISHVYDWRPKYIILASIAILIVLFSQLSAMLKYGLGVDIAPYTIVGQFLYSQGVSLLVLGYVIEFENLFTSSIFDGIRHIISPYTSKILMLAGELPPRSGERVELVHSIGDKLTYTLRPNLYVQGAGTGSSYVAEIYSLGGNMAITSVLNAVVGFLMIYVTRRLLFQQYGLFIATFIVPGVLWMPRSAFLYPTLKLIIAALVIFCVAMVFQAIRKKT